MHSLLLIPYIYVTRNRKWCLYVLVALEKNVSLYLWVNRRSYLAYSTNLTYEVTTHVKNIPVGSY